MKKEGRSATHLGEMLRLFMYEHRYSVRQLARAVGIPQANLHRIVQGRDAHTVCMLKLLSWMLAVRP